ncbi:MAG: endo,4-beta-xylanase, partial [Actinomycetota bacterium]|nr:endo,4-beta-xylanase [Actinomycetota bacterium]
MPPQFERDLNPQLCRHRWDPTARNPASTLHSQGVQREPRHSCGVGALAGIGQATLTWTAPVDNGGTAVSEYTVTASPGGKTATTTGATSATVTELTNGTAYTFTVTATNA